jgi:hypothetical protein
MAHICIIEGREPKGRAMNGILGFSITLAFFAAGIAALAVIHAASGFPGFIPQ